MSPTAYFIPANDGFHLFIFLVLAPGAVFLRNAKSAPIVLEVSTRGLDLSVFGSGCAMSILFWIFLGGDQDLYTNWGENKPFRCVRKQFRFPPSLLRPS